MIDNIRKPNMQDELRQLLAETYESELDGIEIGDDLNLFASGIIDGFSLKNFVVALEKNTISKFLIAMLLPTNWAQYCRQKYTSIKNLGNI